MIKDLYIENFRGFDKLKIDNIKKINFLVGKNNCGKTSILEALMLTLSESRIKIIENIKAINRFTDNKAEIRTLFHNFDYNNNINLHYTKYDNKSYNINISPIFKDEKIINDDNIELNYNIIIIDEHSNTIEEKKITIPNINNTIFMMNRKTENTDNKREAYIPNIIEYNLLVNYLIEILKNKNEEELLKMISFFNKDIKAINILKNDIYININGINELVLLNLMGDGLKKYLSIILPIITNKYNTILVDEMENGLHHKTIKHLLRSILNLSKNNDIQMFFTTHSYEVLKFLSEIVIDEFEDIKDTINVINIVNTETKGFQSYNYDTHCIKELLENDSDIRY
ncbi:AAA family ATPase [Brachyspira murdochii]|uniref:Putative ATPase n=1 Tax=Brachyspira murdochii (strain ATCC 51284 / DSM 12563 / 56-150) TaxID=526224 RepID=D5U3Q0_BRAM5|nr:AAA family ATPase [Brachyspira murdochii]ADG72132.1 putative ATPase [Brachyspira murdochii DSM 12563]